MGPKRLTKYTKIPRDKLKVGEEYYYNLKMFDSGVIADKTKGKLIDILIQNDIITLKFELEKNSRGKTPYVTHKYPCPEHEIYSYYVKPTFQPPEPTPPTSENLSFNTTSKARTKRYSLKSLETGGKSKRRSRKSNRKTKSRK
jgi:hypothetical protein